MREIELCHELSKKICKDLGATPFSIGKVSLTHEDLLVKPSMIVRDEKGVDNTVPVWYGEAYGQQGLMCCLLTALDQDPDNLEIACIIGFKDTKGVVQSSAVRVGFKYDWTDDSDPGSLLVKSNDKWLPMTLTQRLQLALGLENMVQDGVLWTQQSKVPEEFRNNLSEIIEVDI
jgi:hypothetical protein